MLRLLRKLGYLLRLLRNYLGWKLIFRDIGISRYVMVYAHHMSVYDEDSALILVMDTVVLSTRPVRLLL